MDLVSVAVFNYNLKLSLLIPTGLSREVALEVFYIVYYSGIFRLVLLCYGSV